jgi:cell division septation protein DedD
MIAYFAGCSSQPAENSQDKASQKPPVDTVKVVAAPDTIKTVEKIDSIDVPVGKKFTVQIGAFTTIDKANVWSVEAGKVFQKEFVVSYNDLVKLYVVRSIPLFETKAEAESLKAEIQRTKGYEDAWVVTLE